MSEITPEYVDEFIEKREKDNVKSSTINKHLQVLRKMINLAIDNGSYRIGKNPVRPYHFSNEAEFRRTRVLSYEEEKRLMREAPTHLKSIIQFALQTGCRLQEILRLRIEDVDLSSDIITIRPENNKTGKKDIIPIPQNLKKLLKDLIIENSSRSEFVFNYHDRVKKQFRPLKSVKGGFSLACRKAEINNFQFRDLRRTFGTRLHQNGVDPLIIQRLLRHSSFKISEQVYIQSSMKMMKDAVETLTCEKMENTEKLAHHRHTGDKELALKNPIILFSAN